MARAHNIFHGQLVKTENGKFECLPKYQAKYKLFGDGIEIGQTVDIFMESNVDDGTIPQLAKVHACIRELAKELGYTFEDMKLEIKRMSGLCVTKQIDNEKFMVCRSFADASKEELAQVIQTIVQVGETVGINFN